MLLVEDEPHLLNAMAGIFREEGYEVRAFGRPEAALTTIIAERPTLVVTDEEMPGMAGHELARLVRSSLGHRSPRILLATGARVPRPILALFDGVLYKPFRLDELLAQSRRLGLRQATSSVRIRAGGERSDEETGS